MSSKVQNRGFGLQTIKTRYIGPTNTKGSRVKASAGCCSIVRPWDYGFNAADNHANVAEELANSLGWNNDLFQGDFSADGYVFVSVAKKG